MDVQHDQHACQTLAKVRGGCWMPWNQIQRIVSHSAVLGMELRSSARGAGVLSQLLRLSGMVLS